MGVKSWIKDVLTKKENKKYEKLLRDRQMSYGEWAASLEAGQRNGEKQQSADSAFVVIFASAGAASLNLYERIAKYFSSHPEVSVLYGDEDVCDGAAEGKAVLAECRRLPWFKPDWSPDLLDSFFYFGSVVALREELFCRTQGMYENACRSGGQEPAQVFKPVGKPGGQGVTAYGADALESYEKWAHICVELAGGYEKGSRAVGHLAQILFHCGSAAEQEKFLRFSPFLKDRRRALLEDARTVAGVLISIIIPSRDHPGILENCLRGCVRAAEGQDGEAVPFEVIVVDNGSGAGNRERIQELASDFTAAGHRISYLYQPQEFNFSKLCNLGAAQAAGELLLFLNDDVELCLPDCLGTLAALARRAYTGAVGMKLCYPGSVRIQHVGITNLPMGPVHKLQFLEDGRAYYYGAGRERRNVLAVTAACLMVEKEKYREAGGFAEELKVAFNDVDFCFRLYELGYQNVCVNDMHAYHHESLSRGTDEAPEKLDRLLRERDRLYGRHPDLEGKDPYYSPHLNREGLDTAIRPAYLTARNEVQKAQGRRIMQRQRNGQGRRIAQEPRKGVSLAGYRQDACLMVRVEDCRGRRITGYGVVLGDNNACYRRELLLWRQEDFDEGTEGVLCGEKLALCEGMEGGGKPAPCEGTEGVLCGGKPALCGRMEGGGKPAPCEGTEGVLCGGKPALCERMEGGGKPASGGRSGKVYSVRLAGQYRPDLAENMPDQENVALCGFLVEIGEDVVPAGKYRLGMRVRNRVTGLGLVNWSGRTAEL